MKMNKPNISINDPFNKQLAMNKHVDRIAQPRANAMLRHTEATSHLKTPHIRETNKPDPLKQMNQSVSRRVRHSKKTVRMTGKNTVKHKATQTPVIHSPKVLTEGLRKMSPKSQTGIMGAENLTKGLFTHSAEKHLSKSEIQPTKPVGKYGRGYDTLKESLTDFDERINLSKTTSKVNITPRNTTRDAKIKTTSSVRNENLSLKLHDNAIGHTRY